MFTAVKFMKNILIAVMSTCATHMIVSYEMFNVTRVFVLCKKKNKQQNRGEELNVI